MTDQPTRIAIVRAIFDCAEPVALELDRQARWESIDAPGPILHQGSEHAHCHVVVSGSADVKLLGKDGQYFQIATIESGEMFGTYPEAAPLAADVLARDRLEYLTIETARLVALAKVHAELGAGLAGIFARQLRLLIERFAARLTLTANGRVHEQLLKLCGENRIIAPVPVVAALAVQAQTTRETASRAISALERRGIIERNADYWEVIAPRMLAELVF